MWRPGTSNRFKKGYRKIGPEILDRITEGLEILINSERPELLGIKKDSYYAYEVGRQCRILFCPHHDTRILELARVCSHKEVYGP